VPAEAVRYRQLHVVLGRDQPPVFPVDWSLVGRIQARVSLAERIDELERSQRRTSADLNWMAKRARDAGGAQGVPLILCDVACVLSFSVIY
jgi:hypothetical protein